MTATERQALQGNDDALRWWRAYQLAESQRTDELRQLAEAGDDHARRQLASWLAARGDTDEAIEVIEPLCETGDDIAREWRIRWLGVAGRAGELRALITPGDDRAVLVLATYLAREKKLDELRELLAADGPHAQTLRQWLSGQTDIDVLRAGAAVGDELARARVARWDSRHSQTR